MVIAFITAMDPELEATHPRHMSGASPTLGAGSSAPFNEIWRASRNSGHRIDQRNCHQPAFGFSVLYMIVIDHQGPQRHRDDPWRLQIVEDRMDGCNLP